MIISITERVSKENIKKLVKYVFLEAVQFIQLG